MSLDNRKRKKKFYVHGGKKHKKWGALDVGMSGFLVTCNKREREALREAYNILGIYADKLYPPEERVINYVAYKDLVIYN